MQTSEEKAIHKEFELERIILFSDAVFAIAITLLIIEIKFPENADLKNLHGAALLITFKPVIIQFSTFIISFLIIGMYWFRHLQLCKYLKSYNNKVIFHNLLFLDHGIFYEFMPVEEYGKENPRTIGLNKVELNKHYAPVISTNGGLWRYIVGDTIEFTCLQPFRIKVTGRLKHFINAFGEELMIANADKAIAAASEKTNSIVNDYTAAPVYFSDNNNGAHEWLIEFEKEPANIQEFAYELDCALKNINSDYEAKRHKDIALRMPVIHNLPKNSFTEWLRSKGKLGGQHKVPRLSNERKFVEEILSIITPY